MNEILTRLAKRAFGSVKKELVGILLFVSAIWGIFFLAAVFPVDRLALQPRTLAGLPGIVAMPFLHRDLSHLLSNSFPLFVLLTLLAGSRANSWKIVLAIILGSGVLSWLLCLPGHYVGASGLVFGLIGFLVAAGFLERRPIPLLIAIVVGVMYGWTAIMGVLPISKEISEMSHFLGLVTGVGIAYGMSLGFDHHAPDRTIDPKLQDLM